MVVIRRSTLRNALLIHALNHTLYVVLQALEEHKVQQATKVQQAHKDLKVLNHLLSIIPSKRIIISFMPAWKVLRQASIIVERHISIIRVPKARSALPKAHSALQK